MYMAISLYPQCLAACSPDYIGIDCYYALRSEHGDLFLHIGYCTYSFWFAGSWVEIVPTLTAPQDNPVSGTPPAIRPVFPSTQPRHSPFDLSEGRSSLPPT